MLGGIDPVIIFQFSKLQGSAYAKLLKKLPVSSEVDSFLQSQPPIPIYLNSEYTGLLIVNEDKAVDVSTDVETQSDGSSPMVSQKGIGSSVTIVLEGKKTSVGLMVLSSVIDLVFDKVTSNEYSISYLSGATTIFRAKLESFNVSQSANNELLSISLTLTVGEKDAKAPDKTIQVPAVPGPRPL